MFQELINILQDDIATCQELKKVHGESVRLEQEEQTLARVLETAIKIYEGGK